MTEPGVLSIEMPGEPPEMDSLASVLSHLSDTLAGLSQVEADIDFAVDNCLVTGVTVALYATTTLVTWDMVHELIPKLIILF